MPEGKAAEAGAVTVHRLTEKACMDTQAGNRADQYIQQKKLANYTSHMVVLDAEGAALFMGRTALRGINITISEVPAETPQFLLFR